MSILSERIPAGQRLPGGGRPRARSVLRVAPRGRAATALSLVIPTRNEAQNVERLIEAICAAIPGSEKELVFVDDSDDETPAHLGHLLPQADCPGTVVHRLPPERDGGLSTAVAAGFRVAHGLYFCSMDADMQHPPAEVPRLLDAAVAHSADVVVASRYTGSGSAAEGFEALSRRLISQASRRAAHVLLPAARATTDPLSGFFLVRRTVVENVNLRPLGYKILLEVLVRGRWQRVVDVPYTFGQRHAGASKASLRQGLLFARHLGRLLLPLPESAGSTPPPAPAAPRSRTEQLRPAPAGAGMAPDLRERVLAAPEVDARGQGAVVGVPAAEGTD